MLVPVLAFVRKWRAKRELPTAALRTKDARRYRHERTTQQDVR